MRPWIRGIALGFAAFAIGSAVASEVVYFKNGSEMAILTHSIEDGMIRVQLAQDSTIAFPADMVDRIVQLSTGKETYAHDGNAPSTIKNQMVGGGPAPMPVIDTRVGGRPLAHQIQGRWEGNQVEGNPHVVRDSTSGLAVYRPNPFDENESKAAVGLAGRLDMLEGPPKPGVGDAQEGPVGTRPFGRGYVAKTPNETAMQKPMYKAMALNPDVGKKSASPKGQ